jgi:hypothetical protein
MELLIIILVLLLVAVIAGLGLLLYQTISRRNIAMLQMARAVYELVERLPKQESDIDKSNSTTKTTSQPSSTPSTSRGLNYPSASIPDNI